MLIKARYSPIEMLLWTRRELIYFTIYSATVTALYSVAHLRFLHLPWPPLAVLGTAVAFIVGFQNNAAYERIWEARKIWGGIVNASRTWGMQVLDMVNNSRAEHSIAPSELDRHRSELIHRHVAWLAALRHAMREPRPWEEFDAHATNREWSSSIHIPERIHALKDEACDCLPQGEWDDVSQRSNKAAAILQLQSRHLTELQDQGLLWEFSYLELQSLLREMFELQGKSERIKNFPYPRQYATLSFLFVRLFIAALPFAAVPEFVEVGQTMGADRLGFAPYFFWVAVPFCAMVSWVFHTMERIGRVGENPFEGTANDVPISTIARGIEIDLRQMLGEPDADIPKALPATHNVQM